MQISENPKKKWKNMITPQCSVQIFSQKHPSDFIFIKFYNVRVRVEVSEKNYLPYNVNIINHYEMNDRVGSAETNIQINQTDSPCYWHCSGRKIGCTKGCLHVVMRCRINSKLWLWWYAAFEYWNNFVQPIFWWLKYFKAALEQYAKVSRDNTCTSVAIKLC